MSQPGTSQLEIHPDGTGDINPIVNGNWGRINNYVNAGKGRTLRLDDGTPPGAGTVLTASVAVFDSTTRDAGATILFDNGHTATISTVSSPTVAAATTSGEESSQGFQLFHASETEYTWAPRALMKLSKFISADDAKTIQWSHSGQRFVFANLPGYNVAAGQVLFGGGTGQPLANSADLTFDDSTNVLDCAGPIIGKRIQSDMLTANSPGASLSFDFNQEGFITSALDTDTAFSSSNRVAGRTLAIRLVAGGSLRNLTWSEAWIFVGGAAPATLASGKTALLVLRCFGTAVGDVLAHYEVEP